MVKRKFRTSRVARASAGAALGVLRVGPHAIPVALGRGGIRANKFEGDGATPRGRFRLIRVWWRADRARRPSTLLRTRPICIEDGWSEDPTDRNYNRPVHIPKSSKADRLWREDGLYDFVIELDYNTRPRVARRGSAVFIHVARTGLPPTVGCIALPAPALKRLLAQIARNAVIEIG
ncbi:MAG TPA: L,D-transpeptidase family protein [Xanthobacteraceae bacterium]|jgi:L,D-peptidoglycan transpeptidase YkuD (ErfK/YbiS/YcfS/YnhG family)